jgi:putative RNA 2'-phosphotransferase
MNKKVSRAGKYMSLLLRHKPEAEQLDMDRFGFVPVKQLIKRLDITMSDLEEIVEENNKQRFDFSHDKTKIRANQGHSFPVDLGLPAIEPPETLFHGTATKFLSSIYDNGIIKGSRQHVHLSKDEETANEVGRRHGTVYILVIDTKQMWEDGYEFYLSKNGVWLTDFVPRKYIMN